MLLYGELVDWYRLIDPPGDHAEDAARFLSAIRGAVTPPHETMLELGSGGGHNAVHLKRHFSCTLVDLSPEMLALSSELNPECEHALGDMRTVRLGRSFDAVLIHDAIVYMTSEEQLRAAVETAFVHTRSGGAALFEPDHLRDSFEENTELQSASEGTRTVHNFMWDWDPDPADDTVVTEFVLTLREGQNVRVVHDRHVAGLFSQATWIKILQKVGFAVEVVARPVEEGPYAQVAFLGRKP